MSDANTATQANGVAAAPAAALPPLYTSIEPLQAARHKALRIRDVGYGFSKSLAAIPLAAEEFVAASRHLPIVFAAQAPHLPVALAALQPDRNSFVEEDGTWQKGAYIPSYLRRFPFLLVRVSNQSDEMALCLDPRAPQLSETEGEKLFGEDGQPTEMAKRAFEFTRAVEAAFLKTKEMVDGLVLMGLLKPAAIQFDRGGGQGPMRVDGFHAVEREAFNKLTGEQLATLRDKGWLDCIYAHLMSLGGIAEFAQTRA
jgi:hypothetical protein